MKIYNWLIALFVCIFTGCSKSHHISAVSGFAAEKYMGKWYEIARLPNWFERGMSDVSAEYFLLPDGRIKVINQGNKSGKVKKIEGEARFKDRSDTGELQVSFFGPFYSGYRIIKLAPDYRYSVVMGDNPGYLWILGREEMLAERDRIEIMEFLKKKDFPLEKLIFR